MTGNIKVSKNTFFIILGALGLGFVLILGLIYSNVNNIQKTMVAKETALSAQYSDNQNELSTYISKIRESMGVADKNTEAIDEILTNAISGRYSEGNSLDVDNGKMFSAIQEAYPDLNMASIPYQKVQDEVSAGRESYKNKQTKLLDMIRDYESWKNSGIIRSQVTKIMGAPSENLQARVGDNVLHGQEALNKMKQIIVTNETNDAYNTGEMEPLTFDK